MTRKEAIKLLDNLLGMVEDNQDNDYDTAIKIAIRSIEAWGKVKESLALCDKSEILVHDWRIIKVYPKRKVDKIISECMKEVEDDNV